MNRTKQEGCKLLLERPTRTHKMIFWTKDVDNQKIESSLLHDEASGSRGKHRRGRRERWAGGIFAVSSATDDSSCTSIPLHSSNERGVRVFCDQRHDFFHISPVQSATKDQTHNLKPWNLDSLPICVMEVVSHRPAFQFVLSKNDQEGSSKHLLWQIKEPPLLA